MGSEIAPTFKAHQDAPENLHIKDGLLLTASGNTPLFPDFEGKKVVLVPREHFFPMLKWYRTRDITIELITQLLIDLKACKSKTPEEDPHQTEEYQKFVASMVPHCHCEPNERRPCDGVLAGGPCDGATVEPDDDREYQDHDEP